ncbi:phage repressor protein C with HTH and peptisase S24 domain [Azospirillum fermentarium]|uniref:helix-turn-helix transcriptional regulator n=1 Tax=Azospirillum fermentarium TaxID=1233114 RepID=UPI002226F4FC|nr:helix-turn-helix transcriptional regulator [Azospirillum fermentarium]MCW2245347.1 phage repressor protein C with HTH and peptisase S24 domain [Azospirillum fermentarium]
MLKHADIWRAIDRLAAQSGLSASGLARRAGLDPTTFNKSKRTTSDGKLRWPSTESISKILEATSASFGEFVALVGDTASPSAMQRVPVIGYAQAGNAGYFDDAGFPAGTGWDELMFPSLGDPHAYALEIAGDSMDPVYRDGDTIIVSPAAQIRRGDRVVLRTRDGEVMAKQLTRETATRVELMSINRAHPDRVIPRADMAWMARIIWASQ